MEQVREGTRGNGGRREGHGAHLLVWSAGDGAVGVAVVEWQQRVEAEKNLDRGVSSGSRRSGGERWLAGV